MLKKILQNTVLITVLVAITLALNFQVIAYNMMYFEQPLMYVANQYALNFPDLIHQYLHPHFLQVAIPFFRPSGHFLMYYLLTPLVGWHNTRALISINFLFLALSGWLMIKIYRLLFPGYVVGGYLAFAIYLMHPALMLSRLIILHFEYAYIFFSLAALYFFICFTKLNENKTQYTHFSYLASAIFFTLIATTFKEVALMMGPIFCWYFCLTHKKENFYHFIKRKQVYEILLLVLICSIVMFLYMTSPWPNFLKNPIRHNIEFSQRLVALIELIRQIFGFSMQKHSANIFAKTINPFIVPIIMLASGILTLRLFIPHYFNNLTQQEKNGMLFLLGAGIAFLVLPVLWAMGYGWHLSPVIVFFSLLFGFAVEKTLAIFCRATNLYWIGMCLALGIASVTLLTNYKNITFLQAKYGLLLDLNKNAVFSPPLPKEKLTPNSIIVVEDRLIRNSYLLGDSIYPFLIQPPLESFTVPNELSLVVNQPTYNGTLFQYAYLMPSLREEEYPFSVEKMHEVPDQILYNWLQNKKQILCFGYDDKGRWLDKTALFQRNLMREEQHRKIIFHSYQEITQEKWQATAIARLILPVPDPQLCEFACDKQNNCHSFVMLRPGHNTDIQSQCLLYSATISTGLPCTVCTLYVKTLS